MSWLHMRIIFVIFCFWATAAVAEQRVALVIGNSNYTNVSDLRNPVNDATDMTEALSGLGFTVISGFDLTKAELEAKIGEFEEQLTGADVGIFFFSGHGLQVSGINYVVPVDADLTSAASLDLAMVRLDFVQAVMERASKTKILFLDACRNNPLVNDLARATDIRSLEIGQGLAAVKFGVGTLVSYSTQPGNVAKDGTGRNSPFTGPLVRQLRASNEDLASILMRVRKEVLISTSGQQVPWDQNSLLDRIYLRKSIQPSLSPVRTRRSVWLHNGSEVVLQISGKLRSFYYYKPKASLTDAGINPGTLLFEGRVDGNKYSGTAYRFSSKCPVRSYRVSGPIKNEGSKVILQGQVRQLDQQTCSLLRPYVDKLVFTFLRME